MKKYAIYGDDDQQRLNEIFEDEEEIQFLVDQANKKTMLDRKKTASKKKILDTTINNERPGKVEDVPEGGPVENKKNQARPVKKERIPKEPKQPKEKKSKKGVVIAVMIFLFIIVIGSVIGTLFKDQFVELYNTYIGNQLTTQNQGNNTQTLEPSEENENVPASTLSQSSKNANDNIQAHYAAIQKIFDESSSRDVSQDMNTLAAKVRSDYAEFISTKPEYLKLEKGENLYNALLARFENLSALITNMMTCKENCSLYEVIKTGIAKENEISQQNKQNLIDFFKANNIKFTEEDTKIVFNEE